MLYRNTRFGLSAVLVVLAVIFAGTPSAMADQLTLSYTDSDSNPQTLTLDCNTVAADLALAASLLTEDGIHLVNDPDIGCGSLADLAGAMANAAPLFAADIASVLAKLSPQDTAAIVGAVNAVPGVNRIAVNAAVHFGSFDDDDGPQHVGADTSIDLDLSEVEPVSSRN